MKNKIISIVLIVLFIVGSIGIVNGKTANNDKVNCGCGNINSTPLVDNNEDATKLVEDISQLCGYEKDTGLEPETQLSLTANNPSSFSWHNIGGYDFCSEVKNQGSCGSCWAFGAIGAIEGKMKILGMNPNSELDLSEQYMVSCCNSANGCQGSSGSGYWDWLESNEAITESCFDYRGVDANGCKGDIEDDNGNEIPDCGYDPVKCSDKTCSNKVVNFIHYEDVADDRNSIKTALIRYGPLATSMKVYKDFSSYSGSSVYSWNGISEYKGNHAILIVGYNNNGGYWICKNSWGKGWGDNGYFKIAYGECDIEKDVRLIEVDYYNSNQDLDDFEKVLDVNNNYYGGIPGIDSDKYFYYTFENIPSGIVTPLAIGVKYKAAGTLASGPDLEMKNSNGEWVLIRKTMYNWNSYTRKYYFVPSNDFILNDNGGRVVKVRIRCSIYQSEVKIRKVGLNYFIPKIPDLSCTKSSFSKSNIEPGSTISFSFDVKNVGDTGSLLNWEVKNQPSWGSWTITPRSGTNLGTNNPQTVSISIYMSENYKEQTKSGNLVIENSDDSSDKHTISFSIAMPKTKISRNQLFFNTNRLPFILDLFFSFIKNNLV